MQFRYIAKELLYDISNYAYVEGDIMGGDNPHAQHQTQDITGDGNINRVYRMLQLAHAECIEWLYPFSKSPANNSYIYDNALSAPNEYVIDLTIPSNYSQSSVILLRDMIHEYMVCRVVADWMSITHPAKYETWEAKRLTLADRIKTTLAKRVTSIRRGMTWGSGMRQEPLVENMSHHIADGSFFGLFTDEINLTPEFIRGQELMQLPSKNLTKVVTMKRQCMFYAYPKMYGQLSSVMNGNYESINAYSATELEIPNILGVNKEYYVYYTTTPVTVHSVTLEFR